MMALKKNVAAHKIILDNADAESYIAYANKQKVQSYLL